MGDTEPNFGYPPGVTGVVSLGVMEVMPGGESVPVDLPMSHDGFVALPDGRLVTLEHDGQAATSQTDNPCLTDVPAYIRVHRTDGRVQVLDFASGALTDVDLADATRDCRRLDRFRLAPGGTLLAVAYDPAPDDLNEVGFAVIDLSGPTLRLISGHDVAIDDGVPQGPDHAVGMAWQDDTTVRVAWVRWPEHLDRILLLEETLYLVTYKPNEQVPVTAPA